MRGLLIVIGSCLLNVGSAAEEGDPVAFAWAEKLSEKFWEGGDRVFVYELKKPDAPARQIQVADCQTKKFGAMRMTEGDELEQALGWFAIGEDGEVGQWAMGMTGSWRMEGMGEVIEKMGEMEKVLGGDGVMVNGGFNWSLYLEEKKISMAMGMEMSETRRRAPWLKEELVGAAKEVITGEAQVEFVLPDGGSLLVRHDGVLLEQKARGERSMKLLSVEPMKEWSVLAYFGRFDLLKMKKEKVDAGRYYFVFLRQYAAAVLGKAVKAKRSIEEMEPLRAEALEVMSQMYRPLAGTLIGRDPELARMRDSLRGFFPRYWEELRKAKPEAAEMATYSQFVKASRGKCWDMLRSKKEEFGAKLAPKRPSLFSAEARKGFKGDQAQVAAWMEAMAEEGFTLATLEELLNSAVKMELEKEEARLEMERRKDLE